MGKNRFRDIAGELLETAEIEAHAAGDAADDHPIFVADGKVRIKEVAVVPAKDLTGQATNYITFTLNLRAADGTVESALATVAFSATTVKWEGMKENSVYKPTDGKEVESGRVLSLDQAPTGTGLAAPRLMVVTKYENV